MEPLYLQQLLQTCEDACLQTGAATHISTRWQDIQASLLSLYEEFWCIKDWLPEIYRQNWQKTHMEMPNFSSKITKKKTKLMLEDLSKPEKWQRGGAMWVNQTGAALRAELIRGVWSFLSPAPLWESSNSTLNLIGLHNDPHKVHVRMLSRTLSDLCGQNRLPGGISPS